MEKKIDTDFQANIVCPHCGFEDEEHWDHDLNSDDVNEIQCGECEKDFFLTIWKPVYYTTGKTVDESKNFQ